MRVLLDRSHNNGHLVFLTKYKPMMCPYLKRLVPQLWNTLNAIFPKVLSQGGAELLKYADNRRFSSEPDVVKSDVSHLKMYHTNVLMARLTKVRC